VKDLVARIKKSGRSESAWHREVLQALGSYDSIDNGERFQVKRLSVKPGGVLSLQMHHHRASIDRGAGTARITCNDKTFLLSENGSRPIFPSAPRIASKSGQGAPAHRGGAIGIVSGRRRHRALRKTTTGVKGPVLEIDHLLQSLRFTRPDPR